MPKAQTIEHPELGITHEDTKPNGALVAMPTPMSMLSRAVELNLDIDKLQQLMGLQERWEANEARKAFVSAMNAFKANPPTIHKNKHVAFGTTAYDHATLDHVCNEVTQALSKVGISHRWDVKQSNGFITVVCILTHELGHSERTTLEGPADTSGSKNAIQAIASAVTYLQRYTLLAATGLAPKGADTDGRSPEQHGLSDEAIDEYCTYIQGAADLTELQKAFAEAYKVAAGIKDKKAQQEFIRIKDIRKAELR